MRKRSAIIIALILMSIGFAAVSTTLVINGNAKVSENNEDFSVIFTAASLDGKDVYSSVVDETKKIITFETSELKTLNQTSILTYEVTNNSNNYDAEVKVTCVPKEGTTAKYTSIKNKLENDVTIVKAKNSVNGTLTVTLDKTPTEEVSEEYTCKLEFNAVERESIGYNGPTEWTFDYTGGEQTFVAPITGIYKLEVWGAQGGQKGGTGGYSVGKIALTDNSKIFIVVGQASSTSRGGYNGGGNGDEDNSVINTYATGGGGATHIAKSGGILSTLENKKSDILIVAGGGGGKSENDSVNDIGGSGGGFKGSSATIGYYGNGGTQTAGGIRAHGSETNNSASFGKGSAADPLYAASNPRWYAGGGGGGFYGGSGGAWSFTRSVSGSGGGGSGYIGNSLLTEKSMYCYNCEESTEESTKTISTTCTSATATENCAKQGNGYARITLIK